MAGWGWRFASVVACLLTAAGCTPDAPSDPGSAAPPLTVRPPVLDLETFTIVEGLPEPVPVPGEPDPASREQWLGEPSSGSKGEFIVAVPGSWTDPAGQGVLCRWTERHGLHTCAALTAMGRGDQEFHMPGDTEPGTEVEIWLRSEFDGLQRRLYVGPSPPQFLFHRLSLAPGYETLADVLTSQPLDDGNYFIAEEWSPWP